jgi:hypothetical protein
MNFNEIELTEIDGRIHELTEREALIFYELMVGQVKHAAALCHLQWNCC